ncbi:glutathione S-transferase family protein [Photobacterium kishitanii]|uniref:glutathione S-transferase family protein n=1 Tax=Photobacterium kishitanii TaxID=318456 RepID=UPI000D165634|nr:glutathione S-transferase family protein [Photobacterium kishitanii]PSW62018.1 glutathione S-transferase family protein [Photobacterium kishitanii]
MAIIIPKNKSVENFIGLHLYHTGFSNCSMRVRIALEEKGLPWTSHLIDLSKGENLTLDYIGINPNAVVPTLVDNGVVIIDSADIIDYLDKTYSPTSLRPQSETEQQQMYNWIYLARDNHLSIKTYMYGNTASLKKMKRTALQMANYRENQTFDAALLDFHERFNANDGFTQKELAAATAVINCCFDKINQRLKDHTWLAGDSFSLADIAWLPQLIILNVAHYPFDHYPHLEQWKNNIMQRPSFQKAILDWLPPTQK